MILTSLFIFGMTLIFTYYSTKKIIYIAHKKHLFDEPSENRKIHLTKTPNLGGVAMFASVMCTCALFISPIGIQHLNYMIASAVILFVTGLTDDLVGVNPAKKIVAQLAVAFILTLAAGFRFTSLYGFMGLYEIPYVVSILVSVLFVLLLINAFNLIDGINCLAGGIGLLVCAVFAYCFWRMHETQLFFLAISMCGCLTGFLYFNRTPAKIFMGDTGSLLLGFIITVFTINFLELNKPGSAKHLETVFTSAPAIVFGLLIIPVFDTLRVFSLRLMKRKSPFHADRNHIHHRLIDLKLSHLQATGTLLLVNIAALLLSLLLGGLGTGVAFISITALGLLLNWILTLSLSMKAGKAKKVVDYSFPHPEIAASFSEASITLFPDKKELTRSIAEVEV